MNKAKLLSLCCSTLVIILLMISVLPSFISPHSVKAALTDNITAWSNFNFVPYSCGGQIVHDYEGALDPTHGPAAVPPAETDISSCSADGYLPGAQPSVLIAYFDNSTSGDTSDDHIAFRIRLNGDPTELGQQKGYLGHHYYILVDIDGDGFKEYAIDLDGTVQTQNPDRVYLLFNNSPGNTITPRANRAIDPDALGGDEIDLWYASGPGATGDAQTYNHTRVLTATPSCFGGDEYWLDIQLPVAAFDVSGFELTPTTSARFFFSTSESATDPLQKDWMCDEFGDNWGPTISATKTDALFTDADNNSYPSPGDTLEYTIVISNTGLFSANDVVFHDVITDANLTLDDNVTTTQGTIIKGNTLGDNEVEIDIGTISPDGTVTITFRVTINDPLPDGVTEVCNHGTVVGSNFSSVPTDDPQTSEINDETCTPVTSEPLIESFKAASLFTDADFNGVPSPGDTLKYTIIVENNGNSTATDVTFTDTPDANTSLVVGSVTTTQGTVTSGNGGGDTSVSVNIGAIDGGGTQVTIIFRVVIDDPFPSNATEVCNQGVVTGSNFTNEPTNDPSTEANDDETCVAVTSAPIITATKHVALKDDIAPLGVGPGDTLTYTISIKNIGNQSANGVTFSDTPDVNTTLVWGSVNTSSGIVTTGNGNGDTSVAVNIGTIASQGMVTISFEVTINDPFPQNVDEVCNQGTISGTNFSIVLTDNPDTIPSPDPTCVTVTAVPSMHASKIDILFIDEDSNGIASTGDTVLYLIEILNDGSVPALNVTFKDVPDVNTTLINGSVTTSSGVVTSGNNSGDTIVIVSIPSIPANGIVDITFKVIIDCGSFNRIRNQGIITGSNFTQIMTDHPDTQTAGDPTVTNVRSEQCPVTTQPNQKQPDSSSSASALECFKQGPCKVVVTHLFSQPTAVKPGEPVTIFANMANRGDLSGYYEAILKVNDQIETTDSGPIGSQVAVPVKFTLYKNTPGVYTVDLNGQKTYFTVVKDSKSTLSNRQLLALTILVILIVVFIVMLAIIIIQRRQSNY